MTPQHYIPLIVMAIVLPMILLRNRRPRTLRLKWMWVVPVIMAAMMGLAIWGTSFTPGLSHAPFDGLAWGVLALGLALGGVAGWWRGRMTTIEKHPDGALKAQASPLGLILVVALLFGRRALSAFIEPHAAAWHLNALAVADAFLLFAAGMIIMQRVEMFIRARRIEAGEPDSHAEITA